MRFWQAIVVSQLVAGSVYADRFHGVVQHALVEGSSLLLGAVLWWIGKRAWGTERSSH